MKNSFWRKDPVEETARRKLKEEGWALNTKTKAKKKNKKQKKKAEDWVEGWVGDPTCWRPLLAERGARAARREIAWSKHLKTTGGHAGVAELTREGLGTVLGGRVEAHESTFCWKASFGDLTLHPFFPPFQHVCMSAWMFCMSTYLLTRILD